jgi:hypothetical protein
VVHSFYNPELNRVKQGSTESLGYKSVFNKAGKSIDVTPINANMKMMLCYMIIGRKK